MCALRKRKIQEVKRNKPKIPRDGIFHSNISYQNMSKRKWVMALMQ